ncbi:MAG: TonB-dependent receptor [Saprospiraceae bacterium]|nr:TonB-dependent receptor [Saprospiraceae bacterium]
MSKSLRWIWLALILISYNLSYAQELRQKIQGIVRDKVSFQPILGANIVLTNTSDLSTSGVISLEDGQFLIESVKLGRYKLTISHVGYQAFTIPELLVSASRDVYLTVQLDVGAMVLEEVVVDAVIPEQHISMLGKQPITAEQTLRYAATFYDPARLSISFPGVATFNDQNNNVVVRGNSPNGVAWRLEGVDIVNPNHLTNAGTFTDRPVQSGGSVNILSSQLLGASSFLNGAFDATYGNAMSGVFDMTFRDGNLDEAKYTAQISLLGLDFAVEGPISKKKKGSFIANYRYSTIGLLSSMGVELGDEAITFQDLSFHVSTTSEKGSTWSVFGLGGNSRNEFIAERDSTKWEYGKDSQDILFKGRMFGFGISNRHPISTKAYLRNTIGYSILDNERTAFNLDSAYNQTPRSFDENTSEILSWRSELSTKISPSASLSAGFHFSHIYEEIFSESMPLNGLIASGGGDSWLIQPFLNLTQIIGKRFSYNIGVRYLNHTLSEAQSLEPRMSVKLHVNDFNNVYLKYGLHSLLQTPGTYFYSERDLNGNFINPNETLGLTKAHHFVLGYNYSINESTRLNTEFYLQDLFDVPVSQVSQSTFSVLNQIEGFVFESLENTGSGRNYGIDLMFRKTFSNDVYYLINASFYESKYKGSDGIERDTRFNGNYSINFTGGKEFKKVRADFEKTFGVNLGMVYLGGYRDTPIDVAQSEIQGRTVYVTNEAFTIKMKDYARINLRLSWVKDRPDYTRTISIDIQNLTNRENIAYSYYDTEVQDVVIQNQLGIIPILAYRLEF